MMTKNIIRLFTGLLTILALTLAVLAVFTNGSIQSEDMLRWSRFLGRFHPVVLHLPIGLFLGLVVLEAVNFRWQQARLELAALILTGLTALSSVMAAGFGLLLAASGDYAGATLDWHKWLGLIFAGASLPLAYLRLRLYYGAEKCAAAYRILLLGLFLLLPAAGHLGGNLTHGAGYLHDYAPSWIQRLLGHSEKSAEATDDLFTTTVSPVLEKYCVQCHGAEKQKGGYRLDTFNMLVTPGNSGDIPIVVSDISRSKVIEYLWLPESDNMAMPPEGKPRPSAEEILAITHWVAEGAQPPPMDEAASAAMRIQEEAIQALSEAEVVILPQGQDTDLLFVDFQNVETPLTDSDWEQLALLKDRIYELKIGSAEVSLPQLNQLAGASQLKSINLSGAIGVDGLSDVLNSFQSLEVLNLYGSDITDSGLQQLTILKRKLFLGNTSVSSDAAHAFRSSFPDTVVYTDPDMEEVNRIVELHTNAIAEYLEHDKK